MDVEVYPGRERDRRVARSSPDGGGVISAFGDFSVERFDSQVQLSNGRSSDRKVMAAASPPLRLAVSFATTTARISSS